MGWMQGTAGLVVAFGISTIGVLVGFVRARVPRSRFVLAPLIGLGAMLVGAVLWAGVAVLVGSVVAHATAFAVAGLLFMVLVGVGLGLVFANSPRSAGHVRGTRLERPPRRVAAARLTLASLPIDPQDETKHFKILGTTGTGKSTAIRELLAGALARGDRAVIADAGGSYLASFYDPTRGDRILNPFDPRAARWDLFGEIGSAVDADQLARSLIADTAGEEKQWRAYARVFLSAVLRQLHNIEYRDVAELYRILALRPVEEIAELLRDTPAGPYFGQDEGKFFGSVRAVANTYAGVLEHVARQVSAQALSIRRWVRGGQGSPGVLFLPYRANEVATLAGLISTWMRLAIVEAMSGAERDQRLWFIVDELDALGPIDGLKDALTRLRKFGGRCVLGFQSIAQVTGTYGHSEAQTIVENCGNTLILRCSASDGGGTAQFASRLIGERELVRVQVSDSRSGGGLLAADQRGISRTFQQVTESAVMPSEIEQLADLQGYLKVASTAAWRRVALDVSR